MYLTDTCGLDDYATAFLADAEPAVLVVDCSHPPGESRGNHNDVDQALMLAERIAPGRTVLTHVGHALDCWLLDNAERLPRSVSVGRDGEIIQA